MRRKILSMILAVLMIFSVIPATMISADGGSSTSTGSNGVNFSKQAVPHWSDGAPDGTYDIIMQAYTTGTVTTATTSTPTDIVLVLDMSGSMGYSDNKNLNKLVTAVNGFIDTTKTQNDSVADANKKHRIAVVSFGDSASTVADLTVVDGSSATTLKNKISKLTPYGATRTDLGIEKAGTLLAARTDAAGRNTVVIMFTDGQPCSSGSTYQAATAGKTINKALELKNAGYTVYTIGIADELSSASAPETDPTTNGTKTNQFMHYVSSNYPKAYATSKIKWTLLGPTEEWDLKSGTDKTGGTAKTGYYFAPASDLSAVFDSISASIGAPTVSLGATATVVDTISNNFTIPSGTSSVTLETAAKTASDWDYAKPVTDASITASISGNTLTVSGFDFDSKYVSTTPRTVDGADYYGEKLIIKINVAPNYDEIDKLTLTDGQIPTNSGDAAVKSSDGTVVATATTPYAQAYALKYVVDGTTIKTIYRFHGSNVTVEAAPTKTGHTFSGWSTSDVEGFTSATENFKMPAYNATISGTFSANTHDVTYTWSGDVPSGVTLPAGSTGVAYGTTVTVADVPTAAGYTFDGWKKDGAITTSFSMPDANVTLVGVWSKNTNTAYKVEHYLEKLDGTYALQDTENLSGTTGETATATAKTYEGFTYDSTVTGTVPSGTIAGDGSLVLKLYYTRNSYKVTYEYTGIVPTDATALPAEATYKYGEEVTVAAAATATGYTFSGWRTLDISAFEPSDLSFNMPAKDVAFSGTFEAIPAGTYYVESYYEGLDGKYGTPDRQTFTDKKVGEEATAAPTTKTGFTFDEVTTDVENTGNCAYDSVTKTVSGTVTDGREDVLVLKLYYSRNNHKVTYEYIGTVPAGASKLPDSGEYDYGATVEVATNATAAGYIFSGWSAAGVTVTDGKFTMPDDTVRFVGSFTEQTPNSYTVTYYVDGSINQIITVNEKTVHTLVQPINIASDRVFGGWTKVVNADGTDITVTDGKFTMPSSNVSVYGTTTAKEVPGTGTYTVTYYVNDRVYQSIEVKAGTVHNVIAQPVALVNMVFFGWSAPINLTTGEQIAKANTSFIMPAADVKIEGTYLNVAPAVLRGTITIAKTLTAPSDFNKKTSFEFGIYKENGTTLELVETVVVKAGESVTKTLDKGVYYIYELNAEVDGYTLESICSNKKNMVNVTSGSANGISFENVYKKPELSTTEHFAYIIGTNEGLVKPEANITRAEAATIFFRMLTDESRDYYWSETNRFSDVNEGDWYNIAVSTLANAGIIMGRDDGTFAPNLPITRAELVKIAVSFYDMPVGDDNHFSDISDHWADDFIEAAYDLGFVDGYVDGTFRPDAYITRAETMKIVNRTLKRIPEKDHLLPDMIVWPDNMDTTKWYYADVQEATNSHTFVDGTEYETWQELRPVRDWAALELGWYQKHNGK